MVYALHKFRHYILGNRFTFFVDHMPLVYLINKPQLFGRLTKWLLLFFRYDFKIIYKPSRLHLAKTFGRSHYTSPGSVLLSHNFIPPMHNTMKLPP
jgi:hypothetical protein